MPRERTEQLTEEEIYRLANSITSDNEQVDLSEIEEVNQYETESD
jgi:hypothetical protein